MAKFETKGGYFSEGDSMAELTDTLKRAEELCYMISHHNKTNYNTVRGDGFMRFGQNLERVRKLVLQFATQGRTQ